MAKGKPPFTPEFFKSKGYTFDEKTNSWLPPKFRNPFTTPEDNKIKLFPGKFKNNGPDLIPNEYTFPEIGELIVKYHKSINIDEFTFLGKNSKPIAVFTVDPIGKPRMTQQDKWRTDPNHINPKGRQRKNVGLYWKYKAKLVEQALIQNFVMPECDYHLIAFIPMPHSWNEKKKAVMNMSPHKQKPDKDNIEKGFLDSLMKDDSSVWDGRVTKYWARIGKILIYIDK